MNSWDYGQSQQVQDEWQKAVEAGYCATCTVYKVSKKGASCQKCQQEKEEAEANDY